MRGPVALVDLPADVLLRLLSLLPLGTLGAVYCTCRTLRSFLAGTLATWQAAAASEHGSSHPMAASADVLAYLQQQHAVHTNIAARRYHVVPGHKPRAGALEVHFSRDLFQYAVRVCADSQLEVISALTGQLLHAFSVPAAATSKHMAEPWDQSNSRFLCRFGSAWMTSAKKRRSQEDDITGSGFCVLHMVTGHCVTVMLSATQVLMPVRRRSLYLGWAGLHVLVWTTTGHVWVFAPDGSYINSVQWGSEAAVGSNILWDWSPSGEVGVLSDCFHGAPWNLLLWRPADGPPAPMQPLQERRKAKVLWSPLSDALLVQHFASEPGWQRRSLVTMYSSSGHILTAPQDIVVGWAYAAWGHSAVVMLSSKELRVFRVQSHMLSLMHVVSGSFSNLVFSPDGAHFVTNCKLRRFSAEVSVVRVVRVETGAIQTWYNIPFAWSWPGATLVACCAFSENINVLYPVQEQQFLCFGQAS